MLVCLCQEGAQHAEEPQAEMRLKRKKHPNLALVSLSWLSAVFSWSNPDWWHTCHSKKAAVHGKAPGAREILKCTVFLNFLKAQKCIQKAVPMDYTEDKFKGDHLGTSYAVQEFSPSSLENWRLFKWSTTAQLTWRLLFSAFLSHSDGMNGPLSWIPAALHLDLWHQQGTRITWGLVRSGWTAGPHHESVWFRSSGLGIHPRIPTSAGEADAAALGAPLRKPRLEHMSLQRCSRSLSHQRLLLDTSSWGLFSFIVVKLSEANTMY